MRIVLSSSTRYTIWNAPSRSPLAHSRRLQKQNDLQGNMTQIAKETGCLGSCAMTKMVGL